MCDGDGQDDSNNTILTVAVVITTKLILKLW